MDDLLRATPHQPADSRYTAAEFRVYREGYTMALVTVIRVQQAAEQRYKLVTQTRRLEARRRRKK